MRTKILPLFFLALFSLLLCPNLSHAHRVNIFAWVEGETVFVQGGFSKTSPARNALITVLDGQNGDVLLKGHTDEKGAFSFPSPENAWKNGLMIRIDAGEGHQNSFRLEADEWSKPIPKPEEEPENATEEKNPSESKNADTSEHAGEQSLPPTSREELRALLREEMAQALTPIKKRLQVLSEERISLRDILGGLGWIIGLFGIFFALKAKKD
ncbi:MAG: hypothetical protein K5657_01840 [Desulfovibrio sp.]|nr:hypothetical protein [Desulfovibrio sp.]